ncbi:hypothetical protein QUF80_18335 [Desulfococcaceae bacterium HSG8]|nr:hypothetical protein [Desulfococcaceae bacterium HSG8]
MFEELPDGVMPVMAEAQPGDIRASGGRISLVSVASAGEVLLEGSETSAEKLGNIEVSDKSVIDVSGNGSGNIIIRGGEFALDKSRLLSDNLGNGEGGEIFIEAEDISIINLAKIYSRTYGKGRGGDVTIRASESFNLSGTDEGGRIIVSQHREPQ